MPDYRAYRIKNNHINGVPAVIASDTDEDAIEQAKQLVDGHDIELWEGPRFVRGLKSTDRPEPAKTSPDQGKTRQQGKAPEG